jgi:uncharacterized membrane protein YhaH (DUF805 family)
MNNYIQNFIGFEGRLNRQPFWLGILGLIIASIILEIIVGFIFGGSMIGSFMSIVSAGGDAQAIADAALSASRTAGWIGLVVFIILVYPSLALWMKRAHDRDSNGQLLYVMWGLVAITYLLQALGMTMGVSEIGGVPVASQNTVGWILALVEFVLGLYLLVTLGFLKGTEGPNQYGPDPLGAAGNMGGDMGAGSGGDTGGGDMGGGQSGGDAS